MTVIPIPRGPNVTHDGLTHWVLAPCDRQLVAYWCESCQASFPTKADLAAHCKTPGDHHVARQCIHGFEAPPPKHEVGE